MDHVPSEHQHDADVGTGRGALTGGRTRLLPLAAVILAAAVFVALGVWQVERRAWKLDLIARVSARAHAAPIAPPEPRSWSDTAAKDAEYSRVRVNGTFRHDREVTVTALTERGGGYWVMTPLVTAGGTVLVNRGFVPAGARAPAARAAGQVTGPVTVTGLLRLSEPGGTMLRANDPAAGRWYSRDVVAIARAGRLGPVAPYFIDADATAQPGGLPIGGLTVIRFRNNHLVYALTWFGLAILCGVAVIVIRRGVR